MVFFFQIIEHQFLNMQTGLMVSWLLAYLSLPSHSYKDFLIADWVAMTTMNAPSFSCTFCAPCPSVRLFEIFIQIRFIKVFCFCFLLINFMAMQFFMNTHSFSKISLLYFFDALIATCVPTFGLACCQCGRERSSA